MSGAEDSRSGRVLRRGLLGALLAVALLMIPSATKGRAAAAAGFPEGRAAAIETARVIARFRDTLERHWAQISGAETDCMGRLGEPCRLERWRADLAALGAIVGRRQITLLNRLINQVPFRTDIENWGRSDYWAAPGEFFARGGDCEDYAVAKYAALRRLGIAAERMRVVVLADELRGVVHAGLVLRLAGEDWFLDSLVDEPRRWSDVEYYRPIYSLNEAGAWMHLRNGAELRSLLAELRPAARM